MIRLRVHAGELPRYICPVDVALDLPSDARVVLYQQPGNRPRACQLEPANAGCRLHWLVPRLPAGTTQDYLVDIKPERRRPVRRFRWQELSAHVVQLHLDGAPVLDLDHDPELKHPRLRIFRAGSAEPALEGIAVTSGLGHHSHHRTTVTTLETVSSGPAFAQVCFRGCWETESALPILTETRLLRCFATPKAIRLIHLALHLQATAGPVKFETGPMASLLQFPVAPALRQDPSLRVHDAVGIPGCDHASPWLHLQRDGWGLGILDHPCNPGSPCGWRIDSAVKANPWASLPRFAGLLPAVQPTLQVGEWLRFDYRIVLYEDQVRRGFVRAAYANFVKPPFVEVLD